MSHLASIANLGRPDLADDELPELRAMAGAIWREAYRDLIGEAQIRYMLRWMYNPTRSLDSPPGCASLSVERSDERDARASAPRSSTAAPVSTAALSDFPLRRPNPS